MYQIDGNEGIVNGFPKPISEVFPDLPNDIDAAFYYPTDRKTFFFKVYERELFMQVYGIFINILLHVTIQNRFF